MAALLVVTAFGMRAVAEDTRLTWPFLPFESLQSATPLLNPGTMGPVSPHHRSGRPLRMVELVTGERLYVELLKANREMLELRWHARNRLRIPWDAVSRIGALPGTVDVLDQSFETPPGTQTAHAASGGRALRVATQPFRWECADAIAAGCVRWAVRAEPSIRAAVRMDFGMGALEIIGNRVQLPPGWSCDFRQPLSSVEGWMVWSFDWGQNRWRVLRGDVVVATGSGTGSLTAVQFGPMTDGSAWFDDLHIQRAIEPLSPPRFAERTPFAVQLADGDVLFGDNVTSDGSRLQLHQGTQIVALPWTEAIAIHHTAAAEIATEWLTGRMYRATGKSPPWPRGLPPETWVAAAHATTWEHALLGNVTIDPYDVRRTTHLPIAASLLLHPAPVHLGDELRADFEQSAPHGSAISGEFSLARLPASRLFLTVTAADLEPCGPDTPPGQPFLSALRSGGLRTELIVNGELIGDLNSHLSHRPPVFAPASLRIEIPVHRLRLGQNRWELRQQPFAAGDHRYDDCELRNIGLEVE